MCKTLPPIDLERALNAYRNADANGKKLLEDLHGKEVFYAVIDLTERIRTFKDVCDIAGVCSSKYDLCSNATEEEISDNAYQKLKLIVKVLNAGWKPNYADSNEYKYYPYFTYKKDKCRFVCYGYYYLNADYCDVGSRLVFKTRKLAEFASDKFIDIYNDYLKYS